MKIKSIYMFSKKATQWAIHTIMAMMTVILVSACQSSNAQSVILYNLSGTTSLIVNAGNNWSAWGFGDLGCGYTPANVIGNNPIPPGGASQVVPGSGPCSFYPLFITPSGSYGVSTGTTYAFSVSDIGYFAVESPIEPPVDNTLDTGPKSDVSDCGMPAWGVTEPFISLWLDDEPLGYQPAAGPRISMQLSYSQRETSAGYSSSIFSVGRKWGCSWLSYITTGLYTYVNYSGGGQAAYGEPVSQVPSYYHNQYVGSGLGDSTNTMLVPTDYRNNSRLTGDTNNGFTVFYPDGSKDFYGFIVTNASGVFQEAFLSQRFNAQGQCFTLNYTNYQPSSPVILLESIVDGDGRTNLVHYNPSHPNLISNIVDPFGRTSYLYYDNNGNLTNITDVAGNSSTIKYDSNSWATNLTTPYGATSFGIIDGASSSDPNGRSILVTRTDSSHELFLYTNNAICEPVYYPYYPPSASAFPSNIPTGLPSTQGLMYEFNSFHWGPRQYAALSTTNIAGFTANDLLKARMKHWKLDYWFLGTPEIGNLVTFERDPSPDSAGTIEGQKTWYDYYYDNLIATGDQLLPMTVARLLPDGSTAYTWIARNVWGNPFFTISTYSGGLRTNFFGIDPIGNGIDMVAITNASGVQVSSNVFNAYHQVLTNYDAANEMTVYTYNANHQATSITLPTGVVTTNIYGASNLLTQQIVIGFSTNSFTYTNDLVLTHTDARGLITTNTWDNLNRLTSVKYPDGSYISNVYTILDLTATRDRMGNWTYFGYDNMERNTSITNAAGKVTTFSYCTCGALDSTLDAANNTTSFYYDNQGNLTGTTYTDGYSMTNNYNLLRQVTSTGDSAGQAVTNTFNNQGLMVTASNVLGLAKGVGYDILDRAISTTNANGVKLSTTYDSMNRPLTRSYPDGGVEKWGYSANYLDATVYTNQIGNVTQYAYDALGRKTNVIVVGVSTNGFAYDGAGDMLSMTDGKNQTTTFGYDDYGRVTNKVDAAGNTVFTYQYDSDNRLTNRWSAAKNATTYKYDVLGNVTNIVYPVSPSIKLAYDVLNRLTNMVDGVGTNAYTYNSAGELLSAGGLWADDTLSYTYQNRARTQMNLNHLSGPAWTVSYSYDMALRMTNVTSPAGAFGYIFDKTKSLRVDEQTLPGGMYITNTFDSVARLLSTALKGGSTNLDSEIYGYNTASQRVAETNAAGDYRTYTYDNGGQLLSAIGKEAGGATSRLQEQTSYGYDGAGNLNQRTNNGLVHSFNVNNLN
ncbi:MAG TPA: hypothetical protein VGN23_11815, partial [Verrucomicrobiae bacterium]